MGLPALGLPALGLRPTLLIALALFAASCTGPGPSASDEAERAPARQYRIQVYLTGDQAEAERVADQLRTWWQQQPADERPSALAGHADPEVVWQPPYYRVRLGRFADRAAAEAALAAVPARFGEAFVVPVRPPTARQ